MDLPMLCFVRHGETDWNRAGRLQGSQDIPLNDLGLEQARAIGPLLDTIHPEVRDFRFVSSPQQRARTTMLLAREGLGLPSEGFALEPRLRERSWGAWEGLTMAEVKAEDPQDLGAYKADRWDMAPPDGESYVMLTERLAPWLDSLREPTVAVSHAGVARALLALLTDMTPDDLPTLAIPQGRVLVFEGGAHRWV
jgi:broad specificity phosphatase PhoE